MRSRSTVLALTLAACRPAATPPADAGLAAVPGLPDLRPDDVKLDAPETCAPCHGVVFAEWATSAHSRAHRTKDPVYAGLLALRDTKEGPNLEKKCAPCHSPRGDEGPVAEAGVACAGCHAALAVTRDAGQKGRAALVYAKDRTLLGPNDLAAGVTPVHGTGPAPAHLKDGSTLCLACHDELKNPDGVPTCTTGLEWTPGKDTCVSCHMPETPGPSGAAANARSVHRSHAFLGAHRHFREGATTTRPLELKATVTGRRLTIELTNLSGHGYPSGFPGRVSVVKVEGRDAAGAAVWSAPDAMLGKSYVDAEGKPTIAAWGKAMTSDTRLTPKEVRRLEHELPPAVRSVEVKVIARLLGAPLAEKLGLAAAPEGGGRPVAATTVEVPASP